MAYRLAIISLLILAMVATKIETETLLIKRNAILKIRVIQTFERENHQSFQYDPYDINKDNPLLKNYFYIPQEPLIYDL